MRATNPKANPYTCAMPRADNTIKRLASRVLRLAVTKKNIWSKAVTVIATFSACANSGALSPRRREQDVGLHAIKGKGEGYGDPVIPQTARDTRHNSL